jgi:hypothetical protein
MTSTDLRLQFFDDLILCRELLLFLFQLVPEFRDFSLLRVALLDPTYERRILGELQPSQDFHLFGVKQMRGDEPGRGFGQEVFAKVLEIGVLGGDQVVDFVSIDIGVPIIGGAELPLDMAAVEANADAFEEFEP